LQCLLWDTFSLHFFIDAIRAEDETVADKKEQKPVSRLHCLSQLFYTAYLPLNLLS